MLAMFLRWPDLNPSPTPTRNSSDPTPQAMPNIVKNERSLCAHNMLSTCPIVSNAILIESLTTFFADYQLSVIGCSFIRTPLLPDLAHDCWPVIRLLLIRRQ